MKIRGYEKYVEQLQRTMKFEKEREGKIK